MKEAQCPSVLLLISSLQILTLLCFLGKKLRGKKNLARLLAPGVTQSCLGMFVAKAGWSQVLLASRLTLEQTHSPQMSPATVTLPIYTHCVVKNPPPFQDAHLKSGVKLKQRLTGEAACTVRASFPFLSHSAQLNKSGSLSMRLCCHPHE